MLKLILYSIVAFLLAGCASSPKPPEPKSPSEYARTLSGKRLELNVSGSQWVNPSISGAYHDETGYLGLAVAFEPFFKLCVGSDGRARYLQRTGVGGRLSPTRILCETRSDVIWLVDIEYSKFSVERGFNNSTWVFITPTLRYTSQAEFLAQRAARVALDAEQRAQADAREKIEGPKRIAAAAAAEERKRSFQASVKPADMFVWTEPTRRIRAYGTVIKVDDQLVFVQFDNLRIGGSNTRFIRRAELEPWDGNRPSAQYQLD